MNMLAISNNVKNFVVNKTARPLLVLDKYSPQILLGVGVAGVVVSTVMACKATLKAQDIIDIQKANLNMIDQAQSSQSAEYTEEMVQKDLITTYSKTVVSFVKLYGPSVALGALSIGMIVKSNNILQKRNVALMAAYKVVQETFKKYRSRVVEQLGTDKDREFRYGIVQEKITVEETDADGKVKKVKATKDKYAAIDGISDYARFFDKMSPMFNKDHNTNLFFLKAQENYANDLLRMRGHLYLNEVYTMLGMLHSEPGAIVGWLANNPDGDGYVSFGIYDGKDQQSRNFVNGYEDAILLDFNVDGVMYDQI